MIEIFLFLQSIKINFLFKSRYAAWFKKQLRNIYQIKFLNNTFNYIFRRDILRNVLPKRFKKFFDDRGITEINIFIFNHFNPNCIAETIQYTINVMQF